MGKWVAPYRLWRFSHKFEHPKSTPYYFSFPIILSVAHVIILYTHNPGTDLGTVARAQVHRPVTYFENCSLQTGHKEKYPQWYESRNCSLESERVFLFFFAAKKHCPVNYKLNTTSARDWPNFNHLGDGSCLDTDPWARAPYLDCRCVLAFFRLIFPWHPIDYWMNHSTLW